MNVLLPSQEIVSDLYVLFSTSPEIFINSIKFVPSPCELVGPPVLLIVAYPEMLFIIEITQDKNTVQLDKIKYVLEHSKQTDKVYDGSIYFNLFREDVDYFWFSVRPKGVVETYQSIKPREYDIYKLIETKKPKIIYAKYLDVNNKIIKDNYYLTEFDRLYERKDDKK